MTHLPRLSERAKKTETEKEKMSKPYAIGVDLGGTNLRAAIITRDGEVVKKIKEPSTGLAGGDVIQLLKNAIDQLMSPEV